MPGSGSYSIRKRGIRVEESAKLSSASQQDHEERKHDGKLNQLRAVLSPDEFLDSAHGPRIDVHLSCPRYL
jgi:hypothetical protein